MAEKKKKSPKFRFPPAGKRCVKEIIPKGKFHKASFRNKLIKTGKGKSPSGKAIVMVGCPKFAKGRGMKKAYETTWITTEAARKAKNQCRFIDGPKRGGKAGMRGHIVIEPAGSSGRCRAGYEKAEKKAKR